MSWKSKKQDIVSHSPIEDEYRSMAFTAIKIFWLRRLLVDMSVALSKPTLMYCDNKSVIQIDHNSVFDEHIEHIEIDYQFTRNHLQHRTTTLQFVSSSLLIVDLFTKTHSIKYFAFLN